ncbi:ABC transporter substrate-binding protein [Acidihalobacter prosperus]|uniref:Thiamine pyrimidine synthase n=1 Tax=Acidihalobacter prosperus TaxID=160660 RepID=A0A1A6C0C5_9GAMM|nr:ABC transporter substrate-binding protein [Acidihalobacter prosperus]OBS08005.1 hypothetical protein Thpro_022255 [Acidihalobacter prosperus]
MIQKWARAGLLLLGFAAFGAQAAEKPSVQVIESWFIHAESIGDVVAKDKGFFGDLDVRIVPGGPGLSPIQRVMAASRDGVVALGVDLPYNVVRARLSQGLPLVILSADFQHSAMRILSWKPVKTKDDIHGTFATWIGYDTPIKAVFGKDWAQHVQIVNQTGDPATLGAWLNHRYEFASGMVYNEVMVAAEHAKQPYHVVSYSDLGVDWPENVVFTTEKTLREHPEIIRQVLHARYRGYRYAFQHPEEAGKMLAKASPSLNIPFELKGLAKIYEIMRPPVGYDLGRIDGTVLRRMARQLADAGILPRDPNLSGAYHYVPSGVGWPPGAAVASE